MNAWALFSLTVLLLSLPATILPATRRTPQPASNPEIDIPLRIMHGIMIVYLGRSGTGSRPTAGRPCPQPVLRL